MSAEDLTRETADQSTEHGAESVRLSGADPSTESSNVTEIAVRSVKPGKSKKFEKRRTNFIRTLKRQPGVVTDREFESFHALPEPDDTAVFIGMTTYESVAAQSKMQRSLGVMARFIPFYQTMSMKAYVYVRPIEGPEFDLETLASGPDQVLELAVRRVDEENRDVFDATRREFVEFLNQQDGVVESYEFEVVKGNDTDGLTVGMTVYESSEAFERVADVTMVDERTQRYFETFTPVAIQYAVSTSATAF